MLICYTGVQPKNVQATIETQIMTATSKSVLMMWQYDQSTATQLELRYQFVYVKVSILSTVGRHMAVLTTRGVDSSHKNMANVLPAIV